MQLRDRKNYVFDLNKRVSTHTTRTDATGATLNNREGVIVGIGNEAGDAIVTIRVKGEMFVREFAPIELDLF